ncbi:hypothetical protein [Streptomyces flavotricini]|nr:hypothetical protein [Streptomyces flavotricini]
MGEDTAALLEYLFGLGKRDEHTDPELVTRWTLMCCAPSAFWS